MPGWAEPCRPPPPRRPNAGSLPPSSGRSPVPPQGLASHHHPSLATSTVQVLALGHLCRNEPGQTERWPPTATERDCKDALLPLDCLSLGPASSELL